MVQYFYSEYLKVQKRIRYNCEGYNNPVDEWRYITVREKYAS